MNYAPVVVGGYVDHLTLTDVTLNEATGLNVSENGVSGIGVNAAGEWAYVDNHLTFWNGVTTVQLEVTGVSSVTASGNTFNFLT